MADKHTHTIRLKLASKTVVRRLTGPQKRFVDAKIEAMRKNHGRCTDSDIDTLCRVSKGLRPALSPTDIGRQIHLIGKGGLLSAEIIELYPDGSFRWRHGDVRGTDEAFHSWSIE